ncbi:MAG: hypothetical protein R3Y21_02015 [Mycoplasmatota bacterium]
MDNYLIPANSKRSLLIFGLFNKFDLILFGSGLALSLALLMLIPDLSNPYIAVLAISPGIVTGFLVLPIPNYHNMLSFIISAFKFYTERNKFVWKGWCFNGKDER